MQHSNPTFRPSHFLGPRYWPTWLILGLFRLLVMLPWPWQLKLGAGLGELTRYILPRRHRIVKTNIALAFPQLSPKEQHQLVRQTMRNSGIAVFETLLSWWGGERQLKSLFHIDGMEHLQEAWKSGDGIILLGGHFTCIMLCGRMLAMQLPFQILVKKAKNPLFEALMCHYREKHYHGVIDSHDLRTMVRVLKKNQICWYAPDQDFGRKHAVFAPFMDVPAATLTITARLAKLSGAPVLPISYQRLPEAKGYQVLISAPLETFPSGNDLQDATCVNQILEEQIQFVPEQYLWAHRRFKTRPPGESRLY